MIQNSIANNWKEAFANKHFGKLFFVGIGLLIIILAAFPYFFNAIEQRNGIVLNDWLLRQIKPINLSTPIFAIIWFCTAITLWQAAKHPKIFIQLLWAFIVLCLTRIITISFVPLNPPSQLIPLVDPISNTFYGGVFLTKDLFYSGHTATMFLFFLIIPKKPHRYILLAASFVVGAMVLVQHVHYTLDVIAAYSFTYFVNKLALIITRRCY